MLLHMSDQKYRGIGGTMSSIVTSGSQREALNRYATMDIHVYKIEEKFARIKGAKEMPETNILGVAINLKHSINLA